MPDPVEQIFLQARAPTGSSNTGYEAFAQGQKVAQENRRLTMEEAASALQNESNRLAIQEHGLNMELKRKQLERNAQILAGQGEALDIMLQAGQDERGYLNPDISSRIHNLAIRNPAIFTDSSGQALLHNWRGAQVANKAMMDAGMAGLTPTKITTTPGGEEQITYGDTEETDALKRAQARYFNERANGNITSGGTPQIIRLKQEYDKAIENGDLDYAKSLQANIDKSLIQQTQAQLRLDQSAQRMIQQKEFTKLRIELQKYGLNMRQIDQAIKMYDTGVQVESPETSIQGPPQEGQSTPSSVPVLRPVARPLTAGAVTQQQESILAAQSALSQVGKLEPLINSGTFGPAAFVGNLLVDKGLANIYPDLLNKERVEARTVAAGLNAATVRALRSDSNITETERKALIKNVPSPEKFLSSPAEAMVQLKTINNGIIDRAVRSAAVLHQPSPVDPDNISDWSLIKFMVEKNMMSKDEALKWSQTHLPK